MNILVFESDGFKALPEFTATDVRRVVTDMGLICRNADSSDLEKLDRGHVDLLILPYVRGNFTRAALDSMIRFHAAGGSLLFLGDLPNHDAWFPYRNMESWRFHLTRGGDHFTVSGLTPFGLSIPGDMPELASITGKHMTSLRITAFPADETHPVFTIKSYDHSTESRAVVCIERKSPAFFGARLAVIGFNGGEPRENVQGVYNLPWTHDPGLLTREWAGSKTLVQALIRWLKPVKIAGAIDVSPVHPVDSEEDVTVRVTVPCGLPVTLARVRLIHGPEKSVHDIPGLCGTLKDNRSMVVQLPRRPFGIYPYQLIADVDGRETTLAETREYVMPTGTSQKPGYGASTFWAFQGGQVPDEFRFFVKELRRRGCQYVRANLPWEDIEPEPGRYDWTIPDAMAAFAVEQGMYFSFWLFPVTRGAALGDGGVPAWTLKEPAIDKDGKPGNFPTIWSPFYRKHYFEMINQLTRRYADHPGLWRFMLDFGNSDFPYGYYYYGNTSDLFDYSPIERKAFVRYLLEERHYSLEQISALYKKTFRSPDDVPVPLAASDHDAWNAYLNFRGWTIRGGIEEAFRICRANAPDKTPPDLPGHGAGSIADVSSYHLEAAAKHWTEQSKFNPHLTALHNAGPEWGGEAWQVGCDYRQSDDALFQSLRLNANYYTIAGADLGAYGDVLERTGFIRRTIMGAKRLDPELAVIDRTAWNDWTSMANVAARLDQGTAVLCRSHRFDFSCYRLLVLPPDELIGQNTTMSTSSSLLPYDEAWYLLVKQAVEKGLNLLVFPDSCRADRTPLPLTFLRKVMNLDDVKYGERSAATIVWPESFSGGKASGMVRPVLADGEVLVRNAAGQPVLIRRSYGKGSILLAGYDGKADSPDGDHQYERDAWIGHHSLNRLCLHLGIVPRNLITGQLYVEKELVNRSGKDYLLMFSHLPKPVQAKVQVKLSRPSNCAYDLATGDRFPVKAVADGWASLEFPLLTRAGRYLSLHD